MKTTLDKLKVGSNAKIVTVKGESELRHHLLEMGLIPGTVVKLVKTAPLGDPIELRVRDYALTLRKADAANIEITDIDKNVLEKRECKIISAVDHPGLGEKNCRIVDTDDESYRTGCEECKRRGGGRRSRKNRGRDETEFMFGLVGNQNSGKTTLFNQLTGANQHVGNFPGVTVEHKEGTIRHYPNAKITDLPGIYSLSPYSTEEIVTRNFIINEQPDCIINILDATNLERNLYLTLQLIELNVPIVLALNMMDEVRDNSGVIMINNLEALLGIPVVPISAVNNEGIEELIDHGMIVAKQDIRPRRFDFCDPFGNPTEQAVHRCIHAVKHLIEDHARSIKIPPRFVATKIIEGDVILLDKLRLDSNEKEAIEHLIKQMEDESGMDREAAIVDMRFSFIENLCFDTVQKPFESKSHLKSVAADKWLTGKYTAIPMFLGIMALMFWMTFGLIGPLLSDGLDYLIGELTILTDAALTGYQMNPMVHSLIIDGIFTGVGSVLSFLPLIVVLFFFLSLMEDSGYMARVAFIMDKALRKIGLSGKSFVPMLIGFGCSVPAIMATRTLSSNRDRRMTMFLIPFMSCSAKLPIYVMMATLFFPGYEGLVIISMYILGMLAGIFYAVIMKEGRYKGEPIPFVMELPNYRLPSMKSVSLLVWDKARDFITKAFTIIFIASIVIWFLQSFDMRFNLVADSSESMLAALGGLIAPIFAPLGLGDWRISTALITGFIAKESVVSTLTVLLGSTAAATTIFTPVTAYVFLIFTLYYTPCVAAVAAFYRETESKLLTLGMVIVQCGMAWVLAYIFYFIIRAF
ncbi:MAG: ferrous iron transport protein B [Clostridiales bacterium]|nr:ferrous iron transport protein B [Clostridiales bacterium]